ncbi:HNH endonuclease signature motif containing protein [Geodermatophilus sp. SYSU D01119]
MVPASELRGLARDGCREHPDGDCRCPLAGRPPARDGYTRSRAQQRFVDTRDRACRMPGCSRPVAATDHDHVVPYARGGPTDCTNLCCLCERHHRLETHARGWAFVMDDDGVLTVTTPAGVVRVTRPPGPYRRADEEPPPF